MGKLYFVLNSKNETPVSYVLVSVILAAEQHVLA